MDTTYVQARITAIKAQIVAYEDVLTALGTGGATQSYTIDTGQTRQTVTRADIPAINEMIDSLLNRLAVWEARLYGNGVSIARPGY